MLLNKMESLSIYWNLDIDFFSSSPKSLLSLSSEFENLSEQDCNGLVHYLKQEVKHCLRVFRMDISRTPKTDYFVVSLITCCQEPKELCRLIILNQVTALPE
jgi:hypothetical protein